MNPIKEYKFYYVYQITNLVNGKIYVGVHAASSLKNSYLGSGTYLRQSIKKHGKDQFKKVILHICQTYDEALAIERHIVDKEFILRRDTYNSEIGGHGGKYWTDKLRKKMSETKKALYENGLEPWNKGKQVGNFMTAEALKAQSERMKGSGNHMYGVNVADIMTPEANAERLRKISENNRKPKSKTEKYGEYARSRFFIINKEGVLKHCVDENDPRLTSGEFQRGRTWREF